MDAQRTRRASTGLAAGFVVAVLFLIVSAWLIHNDHDIAGAVLGSFDLVALTAVFVLCPEFGGCFAFWQVRGAR